MSELIYQSSNGDRWLLGTDPESGQRAVQHVPNQASGGTTSFKSVADFFLGDANGPEHQALRRLLETLQATILITYDIHPASGTVYDALGKTIQSLGAWWHHLETVWIIRSDCKPSEIREKLKSYIGVDDQLLVVDVTGDEAEWIGVSENGSNWLRENLRPQVLPHDAGLSNS